jgi:hypothetical protein
VLCRLSNVVQLIIILQWQLWIKGQHSFGQRCVLQQEEHSLEASHGLVVPLTLGVALCLIYRIDSLTQLRSEEIAAFLHRNKNLQAFGQH